MPLVSNISENSQSAKSNSSFTNDVFCFLQRHTVDSGRAGFLSGEGVPKPVHIDVIVDVVRPVLEDFTRVDVAGSPVQAPFLRVRLLGVVEVEMRGQRQNYLEEGNMKMY